jgi:hypothetical protein
MPHHARTRPTATLTPLLSNIRFSNAVGGGPSGGIIARGKIKRGIVVAASRAAKILLMKGIALGWMERSRLARNVRSK